MRVTEVLSAPRLDNRVSIGLLIFRIVTGIALMVHGFPKIQNPLSWMGTESPVHAFFQLCAALAEFGGGLALILGLLTPLACLAIVINMCTALFLVHLPAGDKWIGAGRTFEPAISYLVAAITLMFTGPGKFSLDNKIFRGEWGEKEAGARQGRSTAMAGDTMGR